MDGSQDHVIKTTAELESLYSDAPYGPPYSRKRIASHRNIAS